MDNSHMKRCSTNHQRNATQNHNKILPHTWPEWWSKGQHITSAGKDVKKREPFCTMDGKVNFYSHDEKYYVGALKN